MSEKAMLPCFVCGVELDNVSHDSTNQPYDGTEFQTYGHYGSTFWDSFGGEQLIVNICDDCLRAHTERLGRHKRFRTIHIRRYFIGKEWLQREIVPYFDGPEDDDALEVEVDDLDELEKRENVELGREQVAYARAHRESFGELDD